MRGHFFFFFLTLTDVNVHICSAGEIGRVFSQEGKAACLGEQLVFTVMLIKNVTQIDFNTPLQTRRRVVKNNPPLQHVKDNSRTEATTVLILKTT
jgi:hypothetical protein